MPSVLATKISPLLVVSADGRDAGEFAGYFRFRGIRKDP